MLLLKNILVLPDLPPLVVINITPLAPREPYIAVADASFNTCIDSISSEEIVCNGFTGVEKLLVGTLASIKTPSTT